MQDSPPRLVPLSVPILLRRSLLFFTGSSESGKSTIVKQMRIIHQDGFSLEARIAYRAAIYANLMESAQAIVFALRKLGIEPEHLSNRVRPPFPPSSIFLLFTHLRKGQMI